MWISSYLTLSASVPLLIPCSVGLQRRRLRRGLPLQNALEACTAGARRWEMELMFSGECTSNSRLVVQNTG